MDFGQYHGTADHYKPASKGGESLKTVKVNRLISTTAKL